MDSTHPVRVVLFWDPEHARDVYGPYFTGASLELLKVRAINRQRNVIITATLIIVHGTHMPCSSSSKQASNMTLKFISKLISHLIANDPKIPVSKVIQEVQVLLQMGCVGQLG
ncbi:hypothetical protein M9H77_21559 [Catharanthus roseus]|uniref:Uncharacterized protein n=1 Tax=Catharanthus roseus TaxID=4058 RepID=A0ACC0ARZ3_CATRO|nr:hypothetical protein M9H77_21559 [Catharanthus roseus]